MTIIAVVQYEIETLPSWQAYEDKILRIVEEAKNNHAELLLIGEYAGLELGSWKEYKHLEHQFFNIQSLLNEYKSLMSSLAKKYEIYIQPGTIPILNQANKFLNRAFLFAPNGKIAYQDKIHLTPFELESNLISAGTELQLFETLFGKIGISICYDCEFPMPVFQLANAGANLFLVPSCTEKISGLTRVSVSSRARAIENQCYVALSCLIGKATYSDLIDINTGQSSIFSPADVIFPEHGILVQSQLNTPMIIYSDLNWNDLNHVRKQGEMRNFAAMQYDLSAFSYPINKVSLL